MLSNGFLGLMQENREKGKLIANSLIRATEIERYSSRKLLNK